MAGRKTNSPCDSARRRGQINLCHSGALRSKEMESGTQWRLLSPRAPCTHETINLKKVPPLPGTTHLFPVPQNTETDDQTLSTTKQSLSMPVLPDSPRCRRKAKTSALPGSQLAANCHCLPGSQLAAFEVPFSRPHISRGMTPPAASSVPAPPQARPGIISSCPASGPSDCSS